MAIVRMGDAGERGGGEGSAALQRRGDGTELDKRGRKSAKKAVKKHAAKKHAGEHTGKKAAKKIPGKSPAKKVSGKAVAKKAAAKFARNDRMLHGVERAEAGGTFGDLRDGEMQAQMAKAFHHLQRAGAVISLLEKDSGGDLRMLLEHGIDLYKRACGTKRKEKSVTCAFGLLRAAEHLGMAGLYSSRSDYRVEVAPPPRHEVAQHLAELEPRLDLLKAGERENGRRLEAMARELLRRAEGASHDPHLEYELTMAADGICTALEEGL